MLKGFIFVCKYSYHISYHIILNSMKGLKKFLSPKDQTCNGKWQRPLSLINQTNREYCCSSGGSCFEVKVFDKPVGVLSIVF